jgi:collagenase-like PrtC family protease
MELLVNPVSYKNAIDLIKLNVDCIFVGTKETSVRNACNLSFSQIQSLVKNKNKTKIIILINKFFFDPELEEVEKYILKICSLKIDGIMYSDLCVNQILFEHKIKIKQIYNPEALNVNFGQIDFLKSNNIDEIALARELNKNNIIEILKNKKNMSIQIQVCGYAYMMTSR